MTTALSNADSDALRVPPLGDSKVHDAAVKAYFVGAGVPEDQIADVQDREVVGASLRPGQTVPGKGELMYRFTILTRHLQGVPVPDSFAWARVNAEGTVVAEQVFWPDIPSKVVGEAVAFREQLRAPDARAMFEARLPPNSSPIGVQIRHSPGEWDDAFSVAAVYDVLSEGTEMRATRHYDSEGRPFVPAFDRAEGWGRQPVAPGVP